MAAVNNMHNRMKRIVLLVFVCVFAAAVWNSITRAELNEATPLPPSEALISLQPASPAAIKSEDVAVEGCLTCHKNIEPMHKFNSRGDVYETLKDGKDAQDLSCTACHGGNPAATTAKDAHVQPRFPKEWGCKKGECSSRNPERTNTLLAKESRDFVRFINPGDFESSARRAARAMRKRQSEALEA